ALVDLDEAAPVDHHARTVEAEVVRERAAPDRHDHGLGLDVVATGVDDGGPVARRVAVDGDTRAHLDVPALERLGDGSDHVVVDRDHVASAQGSRTGDGGYLAALHQALQALPELVDHLLLARLAHREVDALQLGEHAELLRTLDGAEDARLLEELLGRDAPAV